MQTCCEGGGWRKRKKTKKQTCLDLLIWDLDLLKSALFKTLVSKTLVTVVLTTAGVGNIGNVYVGWRW